MSTNQQQLFDTIEPPADMDNAEFYTPLSLIAALGTFDLDPCGAQYLPSHRAARWSYNLRNGIDGLTHPWFDRVWLNPPYGLEIVPWMDRMAEHGHGTALVPGRTSSGWFQRNVFDAATAVLFVRHRLTFLRAREGASYRASFSSVFAAYGRSDADALRDAGIAGKYIELNR